MSHRFFSSRKRLGRHGLVALPVLPALLTALVLALATLVAQPGPASATPDGENGDLIYYATGGALTGQEYRIRSTCTDGTQQQPLADNALSPAISPDGTQIAYAGIGGSSLVGFWRMNADGTNKTRLTTKSGDRAPAWSPAGTQLAAVSYVFYANPGTSYLQLVLVDPLTGATTPLMDDKLWRLSGGDAPVWSPDGQWIYFAGTHNERYAEGNEVWRINPEGGTPELVLAGSGQYNYTQLDVRGDSGRLLLSRQTLDPNVNLQELMEFHIDGSNPRVLYTDPAFNGNTAHGSASYSPDGSKIVLTVYENGAHTMATVDADGENLRRLNAFGVGARWSTNTDARCGGSPPPSFAALRINEVMLAVDHDATAQYVELVDPNDGELDPAAQPYRVVIYDGAGGRLGAHTIDADLYAERDNSVPLLIGTSSSDSRLGSVRDETLGRALPATGQACVTTGVQETPTGCVTWGCVSAAVASPQTLAIAYPGPDRSSQRQGSTSDQFRLASPTPGRSNTTGQAGPSCAGPVAPTGSGPRILGTAVTSGVLTADPGIWDADSPRFGYRWLRNGSPIAGATAQQYRLTASDHRHQVAVSVVAVAVDRPPGTATSPAVEVRTGPAATLKVRPRIVGRATMGKQLRVKKAGKGAWSPSARRVRFQWFRGKWKIHGATASSYRVTGKDRGKRIKVKVTAITPGHARGTATSKPVRVARR